MWTIRFVTGDTVGADARDGEGGGRARPGAGMVGTACYVALIYVLILSSSCILSVIVLYFYYLCTSKNPAPSMARVNINRIRWVY